MEVLPPVLIIPSPGDSGEGIVGYLKERGYPVSILSGSALPIHRMEVEAVARAAEVIFLSGGLPLRRIFRFLCRLRATGSTACVVLWGGDWEPARLAALLRAGAYDVIQMPVSGPRLEKSIRRGLKTREGLKKILTLSERLDESCRQMNLDRQRLKKSAQDLGRLHQLTQSISASLESREVVLSLFSRLPGIVPFDAGAVLLEERGRVRLFSFSAYQPVPGSELRDRLLSAESVLAQTGRSCMGPLVLKGGFEILIPLRAASGKIGVLKLTRFSREPFNAYHTEILSMVAAPLALAIRNSQMYHDMQEQAVKDELTRILNRRAFGKILEREFKRSRRCGSPLSMILADVDHFKSVNDRFGHIRGDRLLFELVSVLKQTTREVDILFRYAGDEFVIILPETRMEEALGAARRIQEKVRGHCFNLNGPPVRITLSLGVAHSPDPSITTPLEFFNRADQALYRAKQGGRNRMAVPVLQSGETASTGVENGP